MVVVGHLKTEHKVFFRYRIMNFELSFTPRQVIISLWVVFISFFTLLSIFTSLYHVPAVSQQLRISDVAVVDSQQEQSALSFFSSSLSSDDTTTSSTTRVGGPAASSSGALLSKLSDASFEPRIALLMSFPNSGTTYTIANTEHISNLSTATLYDNEILPEYKYLYPTIPQVSDTPFIFSPLRKQLPPYVLTKTHCVGYCDHCHHTFATHSLQTFDLGCRRSLLHRECGIRMYFMKRRSIYKVVHLVRSIFDNIVARMHLGVQLRKENLRDMNPSSSENNNNNATLEDFSDTPQGLQSWCAYVDSLFYEHDPSMVPHEVLPKFVEHFPTVSNETLQRLRNVPCHSEVFRYVQWHNLALEMQEKKLVLAPVHFLYYEDYTHHFNDTVLNLANFLEQPIVQPPLFFKPGKTYDHMYSPQHKRQMADLVKDLASPKCWELLKRYFDHPDGTLANTDAQTKKEEDSESEDDGSDDDVEESSNGRQLSTESGIVYVEDEEEVPLNDTQRMVWFLSFPQSGAQMVMKNMMQISETTGATVHGQSLGLQPVPVLSDVEGSPVKLNPSLDTPHFVLTRNHCDGGCVTCLPMESHAAFHRVCHTTTTMVVANATTEPNTAATTDIVENHTQYPDNLTKASLTLIRNPFDVIRTRMNRGFKERQQDFGFTDNDVTNLLDTNAGLLQWCRRLDDEYEILDSIPRNKTSIYDLPIWERAMRSVQGYTRSLYRFKARCEKIVDCPAMELFPEEKFRYLGQQQSSRNKFVEFELTDDIKRRYRDLPCYSEWLRYIQWHNYALQLTRITQKRERILYFEDLVARRIHTYRQLVQSLNLDFIEANKIQLRFKAGRAAHKMVYTAEQSQQAAQLVLELSSRDVWRVLRRYFEQEDWFKDLNQKLLTATIAIM